MNFYMVSEPKTLSPNLNSVIYLTFQYFMCWASLIKRKSELTHEEEC